MKTLKFTIEDYSFEIHVILSSENLKKERNSHQVRLVCKEKNLSTTFVVYEDKGMASLKQKILYAKGTVAPMWVSTWNEMTDEDNEINEILNELGFDDE